MYSRDVPLIRDSAIASPLGLANVLGFALLSARVPFGRLRREIAEVRAGSERPLWGWKRQGFDWIREHIAELHASEPWALPVAQAMDMLIVEVPGLGLAKAGFVLQMLGQEVACIDVRNREAMGLHPRTFREFRRVGGACVVRPRTRGMRIAEYLAFCEEHGGAEFLWDTWCEDMGRELSLTGSDVSAMHVELTARGPFTKL